MTPPSPTDEAHGEVGSSTDVAHGKVGDSHLISHLTLRKLLGFLGVFMPLILILGVVALKALLDIGPHENDKVFQPSISHYYHTIMRNAFVGIVSSFGFFLFTYRGYKSDVWWKRDNLFTNTAGICALLVAFFPTNKTGECEILFCYIHFISATLFFIILAYISYFLFTLSNKPPSQRTMRKQSRNKVYRTCGVVMALCIVILTIYFLFFEDSWPVNTVFIFEAIALIAFGISWLTKGEAILGDR
ncbi:MAG TPA: hypothetical protein VI603_16535 [Saprospiraceae bacterium]|nr:hypothetical protein [Saprospiraceae bacterium]